MTGVKYLIDNNALGPRGDKRRKSAFFTELCRVLEEVAYESRRAKHAKLLEPLTIHMTPEILAQPATVMTTVPVGTSISSTSTTTRAQPIRSLWRWLACLAARTRASTLP